MLIRASMIFVFGMILSTALWANDEQGGGDEHGGGGHEKASTSIKSGLPPWVEVESRISALEAKAKTKENNITHLIEEKNHLDAKSPKMKEVIEEISKEHRELRTTAEEIEKQKTILRYRYPERSANPQRKYEKVEVKSIQNMEKNMGLEGRLQRSLKRTRQQYGSEPEKKDKSAHPEPTEKHEKSLTEEGAIILQK